MEPIELKRLINKIYNYDCRLWYGDDYNVTKLYFSYRPYTIIFLKLLVKNNEVIAVTPSCLYNGSLPLNQNWVKECTLSSCNYISRVAQEVNLLINPLTNNFTTWQTFINLTAQLATDLYALV